VVGRSLVRIRIINNSIHKRLIVNEIIKRLALKKGKILRGPILPQNGSREIGNYNFAANNGLNHRKICGD
jgi:hypothetical protein